MKQQPIIKFMELIYFTYPNMEDNLTLSIKENIKTLSMACLLFFNYIFIATKKQTRDNELKTIRLGT